MLFSGRLTGRKTAVPAPGRDTAEAMEMCIRDRKKGVENTICSVGRLGKNGMRETDKEILRIMTEA